MPLNCKTVKVEEVIKFFEEDIDGMGNQDGHPRNEGVSDSIRQSQVWQFCELTKDEFRRLIIPDGTGTLIKDKDDTTIDGFVKNNIFERVELLKSGTELSPLIIRELLPWDPQEASFYIEDGAKRAIAYKFFFESYPYKAVKAFIGKKRN